MSDQEIEIYAKLSMHEFLLEQMFANGAMSATNPIENWKTFSKSIVEATRYRTYSNHDAEGNVQLQRRMIEMTEHFCEKVSVRIPQGYK